MGRGSVGCLGGIVLRRRTGGFRPILVLTESLTSDLVTVMRVPVNRAVSHTGTGIARAMRQTRETTATKERGTVE
jgi:hypothetical protein